jgi:UDP-N-acetylmuramoyl-tripeptide--D-alanyl-D-alanine ligase
MTLDVAAVLNGTVASVLTLEHDGTLISRGLQAADLTHEFSQVCIDSRAVSRADLFVALPGTRADGHEYVAAAFAAGARGALVSQPPDTSVRFARTQGTDRPHDRYLFVVPDTILALQQLARYWRRRHTARVVGVTGSIGKTTTKEIVSAVLAMKWPILKNAANLNTEIGLPLTLMGLRAEHRVAVLEMGMYMPGDIAHLADIAQPEVGMVTAVAPVHLERMGSIEAIAREKSRLIAALPNDGLAVLNADDPWTRAMAHASGTAPSILVGAGPDADYRAEDIEARGLDGASFTLVAEGKTLEIHTSVPGTHTVHAFLGAAAVARSLDMSWAEVKDALETVRIDVRQRILRRGDHVLIIDDSYNAAPMSMHASLSLLAASPGTRIAVLGDMLELGALEEQAHREVGERAARVADWLIALGPRSQWLADSAELHGLPAERVIRTASNSEAVSAVEQIIAPTPSSSDRSATDWAILVKGSRGMEMEEVVRGLQGEP